MSPKQFVARVYRGCFKSLLVCLFTSSLIACGGGGGGSGPETLTFSVGGSVSGLGGTDQVTLKNNSADPITVAANGTFSFPTSIAYNSAYAVTVDQQPAHGVCTVSNATGSGITSNVNNITVVCSTNNYSIGGTVSGLAGTDQVTLKNNAADPITVTANGAFTFATPIAYTGAYAVTVDQQPAHGVCTVANATGSNVSSTINNINVVCSVNTYTVGGSLTGLASGRQVTLLNNGADALTVNSNRAFTFATPVAYTGAYAVTVGTQPFGQLCSVTNGVGNNVAASVSSVAVNCETGVVSTMSLPSLSPSIEGMAVSATSGNIYASDAVNNVILKITPAGVVTTLAGSGTSGFTNGTGAAAQFNRPIGLAVDSNENVFVADSNNKAIRKITPAGEVTTYAGAPGGGIADIDGTLTTAIFNRTYGVAIDANNIMYVTTVAKSVIKITPSDGQVRKLVSTAGTPMGLTVDSNGNLYVADYQLHVIYKIATDATITTIAGSSGVAGVDDGLGSAARFNKPWGIAVDTFGTLYVADSGAQTNIGHSIRKITPAGNVSTLAGSGTSGYADGTGAAALFNTPKGLAVDSGGTVYVGDYGNTKIRVIK